MSRSSRRTRAARFGLERAIEKLSQRVWLLQRSEQIEAAPDARARRRTGKKGASAGS